MTKLIDIKGYWDMSIIYNFNERNMWEGQILLQEDGWFEGIAINSNGTYKDDRFIFGVYHPEKDIELFKFTPISVSSPFVYHGKRDVKGYDGRFETIGAVTVPCGNSHIITQYAEDVRKNIEEETKLLESRIERYKSSIMDEFGQKYYNNIITKRSSMTKQVIMSEEEPTNKKTKQKSKKL